MSLAVYFLFLLIVTTPLVIWGVRIKRDEKRTAVNINNEYKVKLEDVERVIKDIMDSKEPYSHKYLRHTNELKSKASRYYRDYLVANAGRGVVEEKTIDLNVIRHAIDFLDEALNEYDPITKRDKVIDGLLDEL